MTDPYSLWIKKCEPGPSELKKQRLTRFGREIKISIVTPTYETSKEFLKAMIRSVREQTYGHWELCIADGGSLSPAVRTILKEESLRDPRIKVVFLPANLGISGNTNAALALAGGDYVTFLDHDDTLSPFALFEVVRAVNDEPDADVLYSDEDKIDEKGGRRLQPHFKPDWSPDMLRSYNYITHLAVYRRELLDKIGGLQPDFDGAQDYDLILRATEQARKIVHIPRVLYHWRMHAGSTGAAIGTQNVCNRGGPAGSAGTFAPTPGGGGSGERCDPLCVPHHLRLDRSPPGFGDHPQPRPGGDAARCLDSIGRSSYDNCEIIIVENNSREAETFEYYRKLEKLPKVRFLTWDRPFNFAAVNNFAARRARGSVLLFLNNDVEAINADWMERLLDHALRPEIGAAGAKLYYPNGMVQHGGVVLGICGVAGHAHLQFHRHAHGYFSRLSLVQNFSAVTGACMMVRKSVFQEVGGFDEEYVLAFNDIDLCVLIREKGYLIVWTPLAELYHHESATRGYEDTPEKQARFRKEFDRFQAKWRRVAAQGRSLLQSQLDAGTP